MAESLLDYVFRTGRSGVYTARICGAPAGDGTTRWHGWIEFVPLDDGPPLRTPRETTQSNRAGTVYWAGGLTHVYLEGAFRRASPPRPRPRPSSLDHETVGIVRDKGEREFTAEDCRLLRLLGIAAGSADGRSP